MPKLERKISLKSCVIFGCLIICNTMVSDRVSAQAFIFAGEQFGVDVVAHPSGYTGAGGELSISVGIDPTSVNAADMRISVENAVRTWDRLVPTTGNLSSDFTNIASGAFDFESVFLHELGHSLGLAHVNLGSQQGVMGTSTEYSNSTDGANNNFDLNAGLDGIIGSSDDIRGDDVNLQYFKIDDNNPFTLPASGIVDSTTYSRDVDLLPDDHTFASNASRDVASGVYNLANTESVMQQGTFNNEIQRDLAAADVAGIMYGQSGIDEIQGTADDYDLRVNFVDWDGVSARPDIVVDFDDNQTGFAVSRSGGTFIASDHISITTNNIYFNSGFNWHFNEVSAVPEPSSLALLMGFGTLLMASRLRR